MMYKHAIITVGFLAIALLAGCRKEMETSKKDTVVSTVQRNQSKTLHDIVEISELENETV